jgi:hypothetical protein
VPALDHLGVARDDLDPGGLRGGGDRRDLGAQVLGRQSLLEHQRERQRQRPRAGDREVVDRAVDRELADRAAREADRPDHEGVGGHGQRRPVDRDRARVPHRGEGLRAEGGDEQPLDHRLRRLAAGAVGHRHLRVAELPPLGPRGLDDPENPGLALRDAHTSVRSRAKRP